MDIKPHIFIKKKYYNSLFTLNSKFIFLIVTNLVHISSTELKYSRAFLRIHYIESVQSVKFRMAPNYLLYKAKQNTLSKYICLLMMKFSNFYLKVPHTEDTESLDVCG